MWLSTFNKMRKLSGMSLDELSEKSGVPKGTLSKITSGVTKAPSLETMKSLVYAMGYTLKDLDEGLETSETFSKAEREHIIKYRSLDAHGQEMVSLILNGEYRRCQQESLTDDASEAIPADKVWHKPGLEDVTEGEIIEAGDDTAKLEALYRKRFRLASDMDMEVSRILGEEEKMA